MLGNYQIKLTKCPQQAGPVTRWWLDYPADGQSCAVAELTDSGLVFQGWVLLNKPAAVQVYVRQGDNVTLYDLNKPRPDVVEVILKQPAANHPQHNCGFRFTLVMTAADFELGVVCSGTEYPLCRGHIAGPFQVLQGKDDWLFLDNDTNKSVEQFTGKLLLEPAEKRGWGHFMQALLKNSEQQSCQHVLLLAPAKEAVYPQFYPLAKAEITPVEQVMALAPAGLNLCYPQHALAQAAQRSFRVTDTHWTPYGAMLASIESAVMLGLDRVAVTALFRDDQYRLVKIVGDLGNKIFPPMAAEEQLLKSFSYRKFVVSDNGLENFGRTVVLEHAAALCQAHLVIFGASSSYSMLDFLCRIFSRITFMHTAGNLDPVQLSALKPDYLLCQTNARYVIRAPQADYSLAEIIAAKQISP